MLAVNASGLGEAFLEDTLGPLSGEPLDSFLVSIPLVFLEKRLEISLEGGLEASLWVPLSSSLKPFLGVSLGRPPESSLVGLSTMPLRRFLGIFFEEPLGVSLGDFLNASLKLLLNASLVRPLDALWEFPVEGFLRVRLNGFLGVPVLSLKEALDASSQVPLDFALKTPLRVLLARAEKNAPCYALSSSELSLLHSRSPLVLLCSSVEASSACPLVRKDPQWAAPRNPLRLLLEAKAEL